MHHAVSIGGMSNGDLEGCRTSRMTGHLLRKRRELSDRTQPSPREIGDSPQARKKVRKLRPLFAIAAGLGALLSGKIEQFGDGEARDLGLVIGVASREAGFDNGLDQRFFASILRGAGLVCIPEAKKLLVAHRVDAMLKVQLIFVFRAAQEARDFFGQSAFRTVLFFDDLQWTEFHDVSPLSFVPVVLGSFPPVESRGVGRWDN